MRLFVCQGCGQPLYFENVVCGSCSRKVGYLPRLTRMTALDPVNTGWRALADTERQYGFCANAQFESCNWLVAADSGQSFCVACRHNRTIPDLSAGNNLVLWRRLETAKRRLFYSLLRLQLPLVTWVQDPAGLAFDFLATTYQPVVTGHLNGAITINLAEADDSERERQRGAMGEPYRTLLGHFRHEIAHYYWDLLANNESSIEAFRSVFGDERADYGEALRRHHASGPPADWAANYVSAYASAHPWEDFAETWAHYFHIVDTLETARAFGVSTQPRVASAASLETPVDFDPYGATIDQLIEAWLPLTFAINSLNRSMGLNDLYPFVIAPAIVVKLDYVYRLVHRCPHPPDIADEVTLKAMIALLKRGAAGPLPG
ncbi:MAG: putative zinc-binding metallopeptidase [Pseudorhodoplanes sp.]|uniref:zinc-binding metallopeptidase family protein n=1 Tax=Pseudorhodoplanes sp. TaxID=1934341 RepID=UPI003D151E83